MFKLKSLHPWFLEKEPSKDSDQTVRMHKLIFIFASLSDTAARMSKGVYSKLLGITKTYLYNSDPLQSHFYIVKLGFTGLYIIFLISVQKTYIGGTR